MTDLTAATNEAAPRPGPTPAGRLLDLLDRTWGWVVAPGPRWPLVLTALVVLRAGIRAQGATDSTVPLVVAFPHLPADFRSNSILGPLLGSALGIDEQSSWIRLNVVLVVATVGIVLACLRSRFPDLGRRRMATAWLAVGSLPPVILQRIGSYDVFTLAGTFLALFAPRLGLAVVGGVLIGATSAEQGVLGLGLAAAIAVVLAHRGAGWRATADETVRTPLGRNLVVAVLATVLTRLAVLVAFRAWGVTVPSRSDVFGVYLDASLANAWGAGLGGVYAWLGASWALLGLLWLVGPGELRRWLAVVGLLVGPAAVVTVTTLDGTRVFAMASLPALLVVLAWVVDRAATAPERALLARRTTAAVLLIAPLLPALTTDPRGLQFFRFPWALPG